MTVPGACYSVHTLAEAASARLPASASSLRLAAAGSRGLRGSAGAARSDLRMDWQLLGGGGGVNPARLAAPVMLTRHHSHGPGACRNPILNSNGWFWVGEIPCDGSGGRGCGSLPTHCTCRPISGNERLPGCRQRMRPEAHSMAHAHAHGAHGQRCNCAVHTPKRALRACTQPRFESQPLSSPCASLARLAEPI